MVGRMPKAIRRENHGRIPGTRCPARRNALSGFRPTPHNSRLTPYALPLTPCYNDDDAKSARRDRSPRSRVMWPACSQALKRSTTYVSPELVSVR